MAKRRNRRIPGSLRPLEPVRFERPEWTTYDQLQDLERLKNPPAIERAKVLKQVSFRLHRDTYAALKKLLKGDGWKFQTLFTAFVESYMNRDPLMIKLLADWREDQYLGSRVSRDYTPDRKTRRDIFDELEAVDPTDDE